jgi:hypothetical protein
MAQSKYCSACRRKHPSEHWYGIGDFQYCCATYTRMFRQGSRVCHPSWPSYEDCAQDSDETGARICAAVYRKDVLAIREGAVLMSSSMVKPRMRMVVSLLASTYYFPWPSHAFIFRIVALACKEPSKASLARIGGEVYEQFTAFRVLDGQLAAVPRTKGMSCTKNPSERRCGRIRFNEIIEELPAVVAMCGRMEVYFAENASVSVAAMLEVLGNSSIYNSGPTYKNVRCCRILAEAARKGFKDSAQDFQVLKRMSPHMRYALKSRGIDDFKTAMKFVEGMKETTGLKEYSLNDFIIYTCLLDELVFVG